LNPLVVVVIPTLNAGAPLDAALRALAQQTYGNFEIAVVDNGGQARMSESAKLRVLRPGRNLGYGAAINLAARHSKAPLIAGLNDDAAPEPQWLAALVAALETTPRAGMCASCVLLDSERLDSAGLLLAPDGSTKQRGHGEPAAKFAQTADALMPSGSAGMYRRELFDELGGFEESFFLYCEDSDLGLRAQWAGWTCAYAPAARVHHSYSVSAGRASALKAYLVERNRIAMAIRCLPPGMLAAAPFHAVQRYVWHLVLPAGSAESFRRQSSGLLLAWFVVKAHLATLAALPRLFHQRRQIRRNISSGEFRAIAQRFRITVRQVAAQ
jgi:GT2 family glycosyltransferase